MNNNDEKVVLNFEDVAQLKDTTVVTEEDVDLEETKINITEGPTGNLIPIDGEELKEEFNESTDKYSDLDDFYKEIGMKGNETIDFDTIELSDELIGKACKDLFELDTLSTTKLIKVVKEYRLLPKTERSKFNAFRLLPDKMKSMINMGNPDKYGRNIVAREFLEEIIQSACVDVEFGKVKDLLGTVSKELDIKNTTKMYTEYQKGLFETNLVAHRDKIKDTNPEKAELIDKIIISFKHAYLFDNLIEAYKTNGGKYKAKKIDLEKFETRYLNEFNRKYIDSKYDIPNIYQAYYMLDKKLPGDIHINDIKKFFILFIKYTRDYSPNVIEEHTFMYYTVMNIITLNFIDLYDDNENDFLNNVKNGIVNVINTIKECDELHSK